MRLLAWTTYCTWQWQCAFEKELHGTTPDPGKQKRTRAPFHFRRPDHGSSECDRGACCCCKCKRHWQAATRMEREPRRLEFAFARHGPTTTDGRTQMSAGAPASLPLPRRLVLSSARARCCSAGSRRTSSPADTRPLQAAAQAMGEQVVWAPPARSQIYGPARLLYNF